MLKNELGPWEDFALWRGRAIRVRVKRREIRGSPDKLRRMAFDSFREFLTRLEGAGELKRIREPVATELEITEVAEREMKKPGGGQALLFEKPLLNGQASPFPLAIN